MANMARQSASRRGSKNDNDKEEEEAENNGYIQVFVKPLDHGNCSLVLSWLGLTNANLTAHQMGVLYGAAAVVSTLLLYQLLRCDVGFLFNRLCSILVPMFSILCAFFWLALYFRRTWSNTSVYLLFSSCFIGETFAQVFFRDWGADGGGVSGGGGSADGVVSDVVNHGTQPLVIVLVLLSISMASVFSSLDTSHSAVVILLVSFTRFLACSMLSDLPSGIRTYLGYMCGFAGILVARYMETVLKPPIQHFTTQDGKIPVIKRRRSSSSGAHAFSAHRSTRRTSLPALIQKSQTSSAGYESAIIGEAHGLITDMLADSNLPLHIVSGLRAVSNLLKPPEAHGSFHRPRVSPLVSLTETSYGSDNEESPYTGERPSSLPKRLRRSLPPSLIRRMSTSTWTTTTSATGMPTLEPEPCRLRSASFRHSREGTPGSSPSGSRSNSPSPSTNSTVILTIPKSRSFSLASAPAPHTYQRRLARKSVAADSSGGGGGGGGAGTGAGTGSAPLTAGSTSSSSSSAVSPTRYEPKALSPLVKAELQLEDAGDGSAGAEGGGAGGKGGGPVPGKDASQGLLKQRLITSDYESCDSPNSSDLSDHMGASEDGGVSAARKDSSQRLSSRSPVLPPADANRLSHAEVEEEEEEDEAEKKQKQKKEEEKEEEKAEEQERLRAGEEKKKKATEDKPSPSLAPATTTATSSSSSPSALSAPSSSSSSSSAAAAAPEAPSVVDGVSGVTSSSTASDVEGDGGGDAGSQPQLPLFTLEDVEGAPLLHINKLSEWDFPIFDLAEQEQSFVLSKVAYKLFTEVGLMETFRIPVVEFINYFHALELGYRNKPYHNRIHATDVLHGVYYLTTRPIPGFTQINTVDACSRHESDVAERSFIHRTNFTAEDTYGIMGGNIPALELMALYTAAAMHDYDHPGRTNAFLVATSAPQAVLYNDRAVLENHHAASAWSLLLNNKQNYFLTGLETPEFKRFRFLVIEAILATDLKRHFEILAEFNAKVNDEESTGVDWTVETDRLLILQMVIKLADINGPAKAHPLHLRWTMGIAEEFYEQGDEEASRGMPISPYMDRRNPQLAKLQETFINHLVAPLCNAMVTGGLLPGTWVEESSDDEGDSDGEKGDSTCKDTEDDEGETDNEAGPVVGEKRKRPRKVNCLLTKNMKDNYEHWTAIMKEEAAQKAELEAAVEAAAQFTSNVKESLSEKTEAMEPIKEESESPPPSSTCLQGQDPTPAALKDTTTTSSSSSASTTTTTTTSSSSALSTADSSSGRT